MFILQHLALFQHLGYNTFRISPNVAHFVHGPKNKNPLKMCQKNKILIFWWISVDLVWYFVPACQGIGTKMKKRPKNSLNSLLLGDTLQEAGCSIHFGHYSIKYTSMKTNYYFPGKLIKHRNISECMNKLYMIFSHKKPVSF